MNCASCKQPMPGNGPCLHGCVHWYDEKCSTCDSLGMVPSYDGGEYVPCPTCKPLKKSTQPPIEPEYQCPRCGIRSMYGDNFCVQCSDYIW